MLKLRLSEILDTQLVKGTVEGVQIDTSTVGRSAGLSHLPSNHLNIGSLVLMAPGIVSRRRGPGRSAERQCQWSMFNTNYYTVDGSVRTRAAPSAGGGSSLAAASVVLHTQ